MGRKMRRMPVGLPVALSVVVAAGLVGCSSDDKGGDTSDKAAKEFLTAWQAGDVDKAAALTDDPEKAKQGLTAAKNQLGISAAEYVPGTFTKAKKDVPGSLAYSGKLTLSGVPDPIKIDSTVPLVQKDKTSLVHWTSTIVHPKLTDGAKIVRNRTSPARAGILDKDGKSLVAEQQLVEISIHPSKMDNPDAVYRGLSDPVFDVDVAKLKTRVAASNPDNLVTVVTLRKEIWESTARAKLVNLNGIKLKETTKQGAATVGKQLIGGTGPVTAEIKAKMGPSVSDGDQVGLSGLQARYQEQLGGKPTLSIKIVDSATNAPLETLVDQQGAPGAPVKTALDTKALNAAEAAVKDQSKLTSIVAIDTKTGGILAAANSNPNGMNAALAGRYPPGSTFKTVSSAALLKAGLKIDDKVPCDNTLLVNGQTFKNYDALQPIPDATFKQDFAVSCNTAFIIQRDKLKNDGITEAAKMFGIGEEWDVGASTFDGSVPPAKDVNERAASMIGQGRVEANPMVMASVAATIASGKFNQPVLVPEGAPKRLPSKDLDPQVAGQLKQLMQAVVTEGSGKMLQGLPGTLGAKTGTAEFTRPGTKELGTHAWMIAFKNDVAVAVFVEDGGSGGTNAGPIIKKFLDAY